MADARAELSAGNAINHHQQAMPIKRLKIPLVIFGLAILIGLGVLGFITIIVLSLNRLYLANAPSNIIVDQYNAYPAVLYVWSGQDRSVSNAADFVAVVDFDETSTSYGHILKYVPLVSDSSKSIGQAGNGPHHSSVSSDGKYFITGGLLSFLLKQKEVFVWGVPSNPANGPEFLYALDVPGGCPGEFLPIGRAKFIVSMMCSESAVSPGDMTFIDASTGVFQSLSKGKSAFQNFNPRGFGRVESGSNSTADYIEALSLTGTDAPKISFRNTVRYILPDGSLARAFNFDAPIEVSTTSGVGQGIGFMELKTIPNDPLDRSFAHGNNTNKLYLLGPGISEPKLVYDLSQVSGHKKAFGAGITSIFLNGKRLLMAFQMRYIILLDITKPETPSILRTFDFCSDKSLKNELLQVSSSNQTITFRQFCAQNKNKAGSHVLVHPKGESRFIVINYFLKVGFAQFNGTRTVHAFKLNKKLTNFEYASRFNPNFQFDSPSAPVRSTLYSLKAYPHHSQYIKL
ncbi:unnamed protein product [Rotaria socialis]|uniref:Uncharacterized protein n=1 Tax=Rotaria socialis TaxID=392032 RepID=A0A821C3H6_9BILA|nr:unnamed protein product [Rotaria socialis]CAF4599377.1 unnamed protein product [Rotaria socialis]